MRRIYSMFLQGMSPYGVATKLTSDGILSPSGKEKWNAGAVRSILTNEKYKGDALLQKSYTVDFLTKKKRLIRAKFRNTMWKAITRQLSSRRFLRWCSGNWNAAATVVVGTAGFTFSPAGSNADTAVAGTGQRPSTPQISTAS